MDCPICSSNMSPGRAFLQKSCSSALVFGWGSRELFFVRESDGRKTEEMNAWHESEAYKCDGCGAVLIAGKDP